MAINNSESSVKQVKNGQICEVSLQIWRISTHCIDSTVLGVFAKNLSESNIFRKLMIDNKATISGTVMTI